MPRRKDNEIYKYKLKNGKVKYGFKTYLGINQENGKPIKVTRQGFATRKEAEAAKTKLKATGGTRVIQEKTFQQNSKTVDEVWNLLYDTQKLSLRQSSLYRKESTYKNSIKPYFADAYINKIDVDRLQRWVNKMAKRYVNYRKVIGTLKELVRFALVKGWVENNPFDRVIIPAKGKLPKRDAKDNYLEKDQLEDFLNTAYKISPKIYTFYVTTALLGLRRGETLGLKWKDIDFKNKLAHICRTITVDDHGRKKVGPTKTSDKYRRINGLPMSDRLVTDLLNYKKIAYTSESNYIFLNARNDFYDPTIVTDWINKIYDKNPDLKHITTHGLRHTLASLLFEGKKAKVPEVQYMLGHKRATTTLDIYTSVTKRQQNNLKDSINDLKI